MKKVLVLALLTAVAGVGLAARGVAAKEKKAKSATEQEARWHGIIIRSDKDASRLTVRKGNIERTVHYDSSTQWTHQEHGSKNVVYIDPSQVKDNDRVICLGTYDQKGTFHATLISKRAPK